MRTLSAGTASASSWAVEQDRDELVSYLERAVDKGNAAALVRFLVFDAIADMKIRKHEPDGLTMDG